MGWAEGLWHGGRFWSGMPMAAPTRRHARTTAVVGRPIALAQSKTVYEGPMTDLLSIDCDYQSDGSILLHQGNYVRKMLSRFAPDGPVHMSMLSGIERTYVDAVRRLPDVSCK